MISMTNLLNLKFWFKMNPGALAPTSKYVFIALIFTFFIAIFIFWFLKRKKIALHKKLWQKLFSFSFSNFVVALLLYFFAYELIPFFSSRFWFLVWFIGMGIRLFFICKDLKNIPEMKKQLEAEREFNKYIPK